MSRLIVVIGGLFLCVSVVQAWEPDEGGIGGTGVHQPLDHTPPDFEAPELPEVFDHLEGPGDSIGDHVAVPVSIEPPTVSDLPTSFPTVNVPPPTAD